MDAAQELARRRRLVGAARALITLENGITFGAQRVRKALHSLGEDHPKRFPVFDSFYESIPAEVPLGEVRLLCTEEFLMKSDAVLARVESQFREALLQACRAVIAAYGAEVVKERADAS